MHREGPVPPAPPGAEAGLCFPNGDFPLGLAAGIGSGARQADDEVGFRERHAEPVPEGANFLHPGRDAPGPRVSAARRGEKVSAGWICTMSPLVGKRSLDIIGRPVAQAVSFCDTALPAFSGDLAALTSLNRSGWTLPAVWTEAPRFDHDPAGELFLVVAARASTRTAPAHQPDGVSPCCGPFSLSWPLSRSRSSSSAVFAEVGSELLRDLEGHVGPRRDAARP